MSLEDTLVELFEMPEEKASSIAHLTENTFYDNFQDLEIIVGSDAAIALVREGEVIQYMGTPRYNEYIAKLRHAVGMYGGIPSPADYRLFLSIDSLENYINGESEQGLDISRLNLPSYKLLQPDNSQAIRYLTKLIADGELKVDKNEHWNKGNNAARGPRGGNILIKIAVELNGIFNDLGLPRPHYDLNHGQIKLTISQETQEILRQIKEKLNESQE